MTKLTTLAELLRSEVEPKHSKYEEAAKLCTAGTNSIALPDWNEDRDIILLDLTAHSHRLAYYLHRVYLGQSNAQDEATKEKTATTITQLLLDIVPPCLGLLEPSDVVKFLVPGLSACILPRAPPPMLAELAKAVASSDKLVQLLFSDPAGCQVFSQWVSKSGITKHQPATLRRWTTSVIDMVAVCNSDHGVSAEVSQWTALRSLVDNLRNLHQTIDNQTSNLLKDARKAGVSGNFEPRAAFPQLDNHLIKSLQRLNLPTPSSDRLLVNVLEQLEGEKTLHILSRIAKTFPCKLCHGNVLTRPPQHLESSIDAGDPAPAEVEPRDCLELLGKAIGRWKIRLSGTALKSLQLLISSGFSDPIQRRLIDMADGIWDTTLAGDERQRSRLKVPLAKTKCGRDIFILWQVDVATIDGVTQQVITVWEVGDSVQLSKAIDKVCLLQRSHTPERVKRCRQKPDFLKKKARPVQFKGLDFETSVSPNKAEGLDVRVLDHATIEMANKFYAFTEPLIQSVFSDNMSAELPLNLSQDEECVISHFHTSTLILGRSGTGKTTCLLYKLVAQYLAGRMLKSGRLRRQVLITRSKFLADKIRVHVQRLIETLTRKSFIPEPLHERGGFFPEDPIRDSVNASLLLLQDVSFPLICTFDQFMKLLENSMRLMERECTVDISRPVVDYQSFELEYWPRFAQSVTKGLPVALVFAEIMGVIKGSARSLESLVALHQDEYVTRSRRLAPTFVFDEERKRIYSVYESYETLKTSRGEVDDVDRVVNVLKVLRRDANVKALLGSAFDEIYIDEVQDQRTLDIGLFLNLVKDCRGFHFAGDTAQAISQESTFRFADIKALFYDHFIGVSNTTNQVQLAQPTMFALSKNYRSHQGILALASQVMDWLWKGFPETIDKLGPEIGRYTGPRPVMFLRCEPSVLTSSNVGQGNASGGTAEFGAEQVILVNDDAAKARLQAEIGDIALILTILQSKGMEFDDVVLWNFFTDCQYPAGLRSLDALGGKEATTTFDARKHLRMCSVLKSLYVAVTRSRVQLFLMESGDQDIAPVQKALRDDPPIPLIDITRPDDVDFNAKFQALRPGRIVDRHRWTLRGDELLHSNNYKDALLCFEKANDEKKTTIAKGKIAEDEGRKCEAQGDYEGSRNYYEAAIEHFLVVKFLPEAVHVYARMERFHDAAKLLLEHGSFGHAANYYVKAKLFSEAANSYHCDGQYDQAAATLRLGGHFDNLVTYVRMNRDQMSPHAYETYGRLGKLLLKQGKISIDRRTDAIHNLGSLGAQELCFMEYQMFEELAKLYLAQERHLDLFKLHLQQGDLEKALSVPFNEDTATNISEQQISEIVDYVAAERVLGHSHLPSIETGFDLHKASKTNGVRKRLDQWKIGLRKCWAPLLQKGTPPDQTPVELGYSDIKQFMSLQIIFDNNALKSLHDFDTIPFEAFHLASEIIVNLVSKDGEQAKTTTLLLAGIWQTGDVLKPYISLPWSPLREAGKEHYQGDAVLEARNWILEQTASAFLTLDIIARDLWRSKWPAQCLQHLHRGTCSNKNCSRRHERLSKKECYHSIEELVEMCNMLCHFTQLYYYRVMPARFQEQFLKTRRYWLERLLRSLTYVSSLEQDAEAILKAQCRLLSKKKTNIGFALEDLLYHRLSSDWNQRANLTWVLEQLQFAEIIGLNCQERFSRALHNKLRFSANTYPTIQHIDLLRMLEADAKIKSPQLFQTNLRELFNNMGRIEIFEFLNMHAITATLEAIATYLISMTCPAAFAIPQTWACFYLPKYIQRIQSTEFLDWQERYVYQQCLIDLVNGFSRLLFRVDGALQDTQAGFAFASGGHSYDKSMLQQRNLELLATILVNLSGTERGFAQARNTFRTVLKCRAVGSNQFNHNNIEELSYGLAKSFEKYGDKHKLVIVSKRAAQNHLFRTLRHQSNVEEVGLEGIMQITPQQFPVNDKIEAPPPIRNTNQDAEYTTTELEAVTKIRVFWRRRLPGLLQHRKYLSTPEGQVFRRYCDICASRRSSPKLYITLLSSGVAVCLKVDSMRFSLEQQYGRLVADIETTDPSKDTYEAIDKHLQRVRNLKYELNNQANQLSGSNLVEVLGKGDLRELRQVLGAVEASTAAAQSGLAQLVTDMHGV